MQSKQKASERWYGKVKAWGTTFFERGCVHMQGSHRKSWASVLRVRIVQGNTKRGTNTLCTVLYS